MRDSKITFRVSDDLLERVDEVDESRSEIMREALRAYLDGQRREPETRRKTAGEPTLDDVLRGMVRDVVAEEVDERLADRRDNVNVTVNVPESTGDAAAKSTEGTDEASDESRRTTEEMDRKTCPQCGEEVDAGHAHCPNCGAKASGRVFCDCGDEIHSDWSFCPSCGRRTPTSHALSNE